MSHSLFTTIYVGRRYETSEVEYKPRNAKTTKVDIRGSILGMQSDTLTFYFRFNGGNL